MMRNLSCVFVQQKNFQQLGVQTVAIRTGRRYRWKEPGHGEVGPWSGIIHLIVSFSCLRLSVLMYLYQGWGQLYTRYYCSYLASASYNYCSLHSITITITFYQLRIIFQLPWVRNKNDKLKTKNEHLFTAAYIAAFN